MQMSAPFEQLIRRLGKLSIDCDRLSKWMESNRFKLNTDNTHFMIMGTAARLQLTENLKVSIDGAELSESLESKETLLGVIIETNLKWSCQVEKLSSKLKQRLTGLGNLKHLMSSFMKKKIVKGVFYSVLFTLIWGLL